MPHGHVWGHQVAQVLSQKSRTHGVVGFGLDNVNYVPPNSGHCDGSNFGVWLMSFRMADTQKLNSMPTAFTDGYILRHLQPCGRLYNTNLLHLTWDAWRDFPEYWEKKNVGFLGTLRRSHHVKQLSRKGHQACPPRFMFIELLSEISIGQSIGTCLCMDNF